MALGYFANLLWRCNGSRRVKQFIFLSSNILGQVSIPKYVLTNYYQSLSRLRLAEPALILKHILLIWHQMGNIIHAVLPGSSCVPDAVY